MRRGYRVCPSTPGSLVLMLTALLAAMPGLLIAQEADGENLHPPIPVRFTLDEPGFVTLVIEDAQGKRVRNLVSETRFEAGEHTVWWDGRDDIGRHRKKDRTFEIDGKLVEPGDYRVRGLVRPQLNLRYEFSVGSHGKPPWRSTEREKSMWLADHSAPTSVAFVPGDRAPQRDGQAAADGQVLIGSRVTEGGHGLVWVDLEGNKLHGQKWVGGVWTGADLIAYDAGENAVPEAYAYTASAWKGGGYDGPDPELRLAELMLPEHQGGAPRDRRFGVGDDRQLLRPRKPYSGMRPRKQKDQPENAEADLRYAFPDNSKVGVNGLAVRDALLVASLPKMNQLLFVDAGERRIIGTAAYDQPGPIAFDHQGRLLLIRPADEQVVRIDVSSVRSAEPGGQENRLELPEPEVVVSEDLDKPRGIAIDSQGRLYIANQGQRHQVAVFDEDGKALRTIGKAGPPTRGLYDPARMNAPLGLTIDGRDRLWVAENNHRPKRISVWSLDGQFLEAFYGPHRYGGGGALDPSKEYVYYDGMRFRLDWDAGEWALDAVLFRESEDEFDFPNLPHQWPATPQTPIHVGEQTYLTGAYTSHPTNGAWGVGIWREDGGVAVPVAMMSRLNDIRHDRQWRRFDAPEFRERMPEGVKLHSRDPLMVLWSDLSGDGKIQPAETSFHKADIRHITVMPDLSLIVGNTATRYRPQRFTDEGVPVYDFSAGETLVQGARSPYTSGGGQVLDHPSGWTILTVPPSPYPSQSSVSGALDGEPMWTYPSLWPGLHLSHKAPLPQHPGQLIGTTRVLGWPVEPASGEAGPIWAINGNRGNVYLFTVDGLFIATLFKDHRQRGAGWNMHETQRGMLLNDVTSGQEHFFPTITRADDGQVYLTVGVGNASSFVHVENLDQIRRLPEQSVAVSAEQIEAARKYLLDREAKRREETGRPTLAVRRTEKPIKIDGNTDEWKDGPWAPIDDKIRAAIRYDDSRLYLAFRTPDEGLLENSAQPWQALFIGGGGLDLMLGTDPQADVNRRKATAGDVRLVVAKLDGETAAVLYRPVAAEGSQPDGEAFVFTSPVRTLRFDSVAAVAEQVQVAAGKRGDYELAVPLDLLGLDPKPGQAILGDVGILRGDGGRTEHRLYWSNKMAGLTADVPGEAELTPRLWGKLEFEQAEEMGE